MSDGSSHSRSNGHEPKTLKSMEEAPALGMAPPVAHSGS